MFILFKDNYFSWHKIIIDVAGGIPCLAMLQGSDIPQPLEASPGQTVGRSNMTGSVAGLPLAVVPVVVGRPVVPSAAKLGSLGSLGSFSPVAGTPFAPRLASW
jgi:hypothetical protein